MPTLKLTPKQVLNQKQDLVVADYVDNIVAAKMSQKSIKILIAFNVIANW